MNSGVNPGSTPEILCPRCPLCGAKPPFIWPSFAQAFCPNEECDVIVWEPWVSLAENLMNANTVDFLRPEEGPPSDRFPND